MKQLTTPKSLILAFTLACTGLLLLPRFGAAQNIIDKVREKVKTVTDPKSAIQVDNHPDVLLIDSLLKDPKLFRLTSKELRMGFYPPHILKSGLILLRRADGWRLVTPELDIVMHFPPTLRTEYGDLYAGELYVDANGNIYTGGKRYFFPDYKTTDDFPIVDIRDSVTLYERQCNEKYGGDAPSANSCIRYRVNKLNAMVGLPECYGQHFKPCDFVGVINGYFVIQGPNSNRESDFDMEGVPFQQFDESRKVDYYPGTGRAGYPHYIWMKYYVTPKGQRFKCIGSMYLNYFEIKGKDYIVTTTGMYEML